MDRKRDGKKMNLGNTCFFGVPNKNKLVRRKNISKYYQSLNKQLLNKIVKKKNL